MRFIILLPFVLASPFFRRNDPGLLDGILGNNNDDHLGVLLGGGSRRNRGLLGSSGLLGTGIGGSRGLLGTGLLGNDGLGSKHRGHGRHHENHYYHIDYYNGNDNYDYGNNDYYNQPKNNYRY